MKASSLIKILSICPDAEVKMIIEDDGVEHDYDISVLTEVIGDEMDFRIVVGE